jgi:hypothetical protein
MTNTDLSVFTNKDEVSLADRLRVVLKNSSFFDVLVGYFRITGFYLLYQHMTDIQEIRILIGLGTDKDTVKVVDLIETSGDEAVDCLRKNIVDEFNDSENTPEVEKGINVFLTWLTAGKLKIRMCRDKNVHAKIFIVRKNPQIVPDQFGNLITGSSNFSYNGLEKNIEFNVELKNSSDVKYALGFFEDLWSQSDEISDDLISIVKNETWMVDTISPYEMFLRALYVYFEEEIGENYIDIPRPEGFIKLEYQEHAVIQARKIIDRHGGVFIADVVGLGKTYIAAMLGKLLKGRKLFIVPPVVKDYWESVLGSFLFSKNDLVVSLGLVDKIVKWKDLSSFQYVFVDEAHRFRNADSIEYQYLKEICYGKKVILITATPQNNTISDIANLITLFQDSRKSSIMPNCEDLDTYFKTLKTQVFEAKGTPEYELTITHVASKIRNDVLRHVMIRRTRNEIKTFYAEDIEKQDLVFPMMKDPIRLAYTYSPEMDKAFVDSVNLLERLNYARYTPLLFVKDKSLVAENKAGQENLKSFVKVMLVKRLESSIYAFRQSINRLQQNSENFLKLFREDKVVIGAMSKTKIDMDDLLSMSDEEFEDFVGRKDIMVLQKADFEDHYEDLLKKDNRILGQLQIMWGAFDLQNNDAKFDKLISLLKEIKSNNKVIIFSEAKDTLVYLEPKLDAIFPGEVISYHGSDSKNKKTIIEANYDPKYHGEHLNDKKILVATDALSEGVNLHRANVVINYDLPWNPTRVMQRVGRINRIGSEYSVLYLYNFFPSVNTREHLSLEDAIKAKIQMFNTLLGSDAKYITEDDSVDEFGLYDMLMMSSKLPDEEEMTENATKMQYLQIINQVRKNNPDLYSKIKGLPNKIRIARYKLPQGLLSFMKKGLIKRFFLCDGESEVKELDFETAIKLFSTTDEIEKTQLPEQYYDLMIKNYAKFVEDMESEVVIAAKGTKYPPNENKVRAFLKFLKKSDQIDYKEREYFTKVEKAMNFGRLDKIVYKKIVAALKDDAHDLSAIIAAFKNNIPQAYLKDRNNYVIISSKDEKNIIVLSEYFVKK